MPAISGRNGAIKIGTNEVADVKQYSISETMDSIDVTAMSDTHRRTIEGMKSWSGSLTCNYLKDDANGQDLLAVGATLDVTFIVEGDVSGNEKYDGKIIVTGLSMNVGTDTVVERNIEFNGVGPITKGTL